ncbi:MAG: hypothetical protein ACYC35_27320 [Pirellulales bacterium]
MSVRTIYNDAKFARAVDAIAENVGPEVKTLCLAGKIRRANILKIVQLSPEQQREVFRLKTYNNKPKRETPPAPPVRLGHEVERLKKSICIELLGWTTDLYEFAGPVLREIANEIGKRGVPSVLKAAGVLEDGDDE